MTFDFIQINFLLCFLPFFFLAYMLTPGKWKNVTLLLGSIIFYVFGEPEYLWVLPASITFNFLFGLLLERKKKSGILWLAIVLNAAMLAMFKMLGGKIPLGISFYTFQAIAYLVDIYRGKTMAEGSIIRFALFLGMFPKLGCGPIVTYAGIRDSLSERKVTAERFQKGLQFFILGLSFKVLLTDRLQILWHDLEVAGYESITWRYAWIGAVAFSLKLYFDFYGYSLMAIGLGAMLGFELPENFNTPYLAGSVREFYRRWHITLGAWFRDYVYIPLGGSKAGELRTVWNLLIVWALTGIWHGMTANFWLWGLFLWCLIVLERFAGKLSFVKKMKVLPHVYLLFVIVLSWMLFAITDLSQLWIFLNRMFGVGEPLNGNVNDWWIALGRHGGVLAAGVFCASGLLEKFLQKHEKAFWLNLILTFLFWICVWKIMRQGSNPFQYVNF